MFVIGPSLIALGIPIGSGEWLLGPQAVGQYGLGWMIVVPAVAQTFYNVECARYIVGDGRGAGGRLGPGPARRAAPGPAVGVRRDSRVHRGRLGGVRGPYYPFMIVLLVPISIILHLAVPVTLVQSWANTSTWAPSSTRSCRCTSTAGCRARGTTCSWC